MRNNDLSIHVLHIFLLLLINFKQISYLIFTIEYTKVFNARQNLIEKKNENEMVLSEFNLMDADAAVFKLVGPILAKQDISEAKNNVEKRIEFITKEIDRMDKLELDFQAKVEEKKKNIMKQQEDFKRIVM